MIYGVFNTTSPYLTTHYLGQGEKIINDYPDTVRLGDVYEGYIPANPEKHREIWSGQIKQALIDELEMSDLEAQSVMSKLVDMELEEAFVYLEEKYDWYSARYMYEDSAYYKGTPEEINRYLNEKMKNKAFSFYYSRKFADFAGLFMCFFATIMLAVLFLQDTKKHTYELLHTKPITAGKYVFGKVSAGFAICLIALTIINLLFWALCVIYTKDSGFEVRFWDFIVSTVLYILPNMLMIVSVYTLISLIFKNPLPGVPLLILYMVYSNMGGRNAEGVYGYWGRPFAIMVRFPDQLFDTTPPPKRKERNHSSRIKCSAAGRSCWHSKSAAHKKKRYTFVYLFFLANNPNFNRISRGCIFGAKGGAVVFGNAPPLWKISHD